MQPQTTTTAIVGKGLFSIRKIGCELGMSKTTLQRQLGAVKKKRQLLIPQKSCFNIRLLASRVYCMSKSYISSKPSPVQNDHARLYCA